MNGKTSDINNIEELRGALRCQPPNQKNRGPAFPLSVYSLLLAVLLFPLSLSLSGCGLTSGSATRTPGPGGLTILTSSLSTAKVQASYSATLSASGGKQPYTWNVSSGTLPVGLSLSSSTGKISGTPTQTGNFNFTAKVVDSSSTPQSDTQALTLNVSSSSAPPPASTLIITTNSLPAAQVSVAYTTTLAASNGQSPYTWSMASGSASLPPGLSLSGSTGAISGTPTSSNAFVFTVQVKDSSSTPETATHTYTMTTIGVALDQYGGRTDIKCATVTPYFHLEKINSKWFFCDPLGNGYISMNVSAVTPNGNPTPDCNGVNTYPIYATKYGDTTYNWGFQTLRRITSWGFNSVGQDSSGHVGPNDTCSGCAWPVGVQPIPVPYVLEDKPAESAAINQPINNVTVLTSPLKDEISGTNNNYTSWRGASTYDVFDPALNTWFQNELQNLGNPGVQQLTTNNPYLLGIFTDDSDYFWGSGSGPDFANGHTNANIAWTTLITAPAQTYSQSTPFGHKTVLYTTPQNFTKTQATNPATACSVFSPCSLRDYLWQKYSGNIANLNAAWGSNYTTFDSTGTQVTGEVIGTGNGSTLTFTHTLVHSSVSPYSVLISVAGTPQIGDCPWFHSACIATIANTGSLGTPTASLLVQATSTVNYSSGTITLVFASAPASGVAITANYVYHGWMAAGTGLMDEDGSHTAWVGTNPMCLEGPDPSYPTYYACVGGGGNNEPVPNANTALGADLDNWVPQMAAKYFKTVHDDLRAVTNVPYLGLDTMGAWGGPAYSKFLQGAAPYIDGAYVTLFQQGLSPSPAAFQSAYQYTTQYLGDVPLVDFFTLLAQPDSSMSCFSTTSFENYSTQNARGQEYYNTISYLLSTPGKNGTIPFVGFSWWAWRDFQSANQGLVSIHDNAYDGVEAVSAVVPCESNYSVLSGANCGGESANYGDVITPVRNANLYWILH